MPPSTSLISREGPCCSTSAWVFRRWSVSGTICKPSTARTRPASRRTSSTRGGASPVEGLIAIVGLESHPEGGKRGAYDRISFFDPAGLASGAPVVSVDREKKEAVGRQARQRRSRVAARRRAHRGPRPRPLPAGAREGRPLRSPRRGRRRGLGERRHVPRHGAPRRRLPTVVVGPDGEREVRRDGQAPPGPRRRRVQRQPRQAPGARAAALLRPQPHGGGPATCLPAPQSETRSSTASSPRSPATGAAGLRGRLRRSPAPSPRRRPQGASGSCARSTPARTRPGSGSPTRRRAPSTSPGRTSTASGTTS